MNSGQDDPLNVTTTVADQSWYRNVVDFISAKSEQWLRSGCQVVWLIDPGRETAAVCTLEDGAYVMRSVATLTDAELLPGFELPVSELFKQ